MIKEKKCKGQNTAKDFEGCGKMTKVEQRKLGLCQSCYRDWLLESKKGQEHFDKMLIKNKVQFERKQRAIDKKQREQLTDYKPKLQTVVNQISRLIDIGLPCLARGYHANQIHAGHVYARGGNQIMRYNLHNIHRQSAQSNKSGNDDGLLREGLVNEYGQDYMNFISELRQTPPVKYTNPEYIELYKNACKIANMLKKQGKTYPFPEQRIEMRNEINNALGIYDQKYCEYKSLNNE